jgi:hypothetical protein
VNVAAARDAVDQRDDHLPLEEQPDDDEGDEPERMEEPMRCEE